MKAGVFSCLGLGDGLIALVLSNNLHLNGYEVTTFHPSLSALQSWFPHLPIRAFPSKVESTLQSLDRLFILFEKTPWMEKVLKVALKKYRDKTVILNPIATANSDYPYWEEGRFDGTKNVVHNLYTFCKEQLCLPISTRSNGITPPSHLHYRSTLKRILIHPTSSREGKNWPQDKFLKISEELETQGFKPAFILTRAERKQWRLPAAKMPLFSNLSELASYMYASGFFIGNDSGPGHLASNLEIPTLSIFRNHKTALFWRPSWTKGEVIYPSSWIPNLKGLRSRDRHWKKWVSVNKVLRGFSKLCKLCHK